MFKHYLTFALRNLIRNKIYSSINIIVLAIGLASFFFITIYVVNELSYNRIYSKKNLIHRVVTNHEDFDNFKNGLSGYSVGARFTEAFPEVESSTTCRSVRISVLINDQDYSEVVQCTNSNLFKIFDLPIVAGDRTNPLKELNSVVISESIAEKYFKDDNPIGKTLEAYNRSTKWNLVVTAVTKDIPWNSSLQGKIFVNIDLYLADHIKWYDIKNIAEQWQGSFLTYLLINENADIVKLEQKANELFKKHSDGKQKLSYEFQSLKDIYLYSDDIANNGLAKGNLNNIIVFTIIGFLILIIAGFNFIILSSAQTLNRHKEFGFRKVVGGAHTSCFKQFFIESIVTNLIVFPLALILVIIFMPHVSDLFGHNIEFKNSNMVIYIPLFLLIIIILSLFSGAYISISSAKMQAIDIIRGNSNLGKRKFILQKVMIVFQIMIFIGLLIATLSIRKQIKFSLNADMGFQTENILKIRWPYYKKINYDAILEDIKANPYIVSASYGSDGPPSFNYAKSKWSRVDKPEEEIECEFVVVGYNYLEAYGFEIVEGRFFSKDYGTDDTAYILNETAVKDLGIKDISKTPYHIVGVVKDFHLHSLKEKINPIAIGIAKNYIDELLVKYDNEHEKEVLEFLESRWELHVPEQTFNYIFIKDSIRNLYYKEYEFIKIITIFTLMAIFIASLGLFGLTLFTIERRSKEIGIRKIHGASINKIMMMINKEFAYLVGIASIIAFPIAWYFMDKWLQNFAYTINTPYELYVLSGLVALLIVLFTVSIRSLKAAYSNPVDTIKYE